MKTDVDWALRLWVVFVVVYSMRAIMKLNQAF